MEFKQLLEVDNNPTKTAKKIIQGEHKNWLGHILIDKNIFLTSVEFGKNDSVFLAGLFKFNKKFYGLCTITTKKIKTRSV